ARVDEVTAESGHEGRSAAMLAAGRGGPPLGTAALATAVAFVALELSPVPMVRGFGLLLVVGVAVALGCALTAGAAVLTIAIDAGRPDRRRRAVRASIRGAAELAAWVPGRVAAAVAPSGRGAGRPGGAGGGGAAGRRGPRGPRGPAPGRGGGGRGRPAGARAGGGGGA